MKRKYHGVTVLSVSMAALAAMGVYMGTGLWQNRESHNRIPQRAAINIKVPAEKQVRLMEKLYGRMPLLAVPAKRPVAGKKLSLFGYQVPDQAAIGDGIAAKDALEQSGFQLSLVVLAGLNNYCIVDGKFMAEGAHMEDGTRVLKIESHRVLVARNHERKWIYLEDAAPSTVTTDQNEVSAGQKGPS
ncbi:MAG: hypothetical protein PVH87_10930 [Desulfobacteraceae bacterium]|jgi:hypothetical protein